MNRFGLLIVLVALTLLAPRGGTAADPVTDWIRAAAIPLPPAGEPLGPEAAAAFAAAVGEARVVALGESRHDLREQTLQKGALVRVLVEDLGFRGFILEESLPHAEALDRAVQPDGPPLAETLSALAGWYLWDTEEFRDQLAWIREFNASRPADDRVHVAGMDITAPAEGVRKVLTGLHDARIDAPPADGFRLELQPDYWGMAREALLALPPDSLAGVEWCYEDLARVAREADAPDRTRLLRLALAALEGFRFLVASDPGELGDIREAGMTAVILSLLNQEFAGKRVAIWTHNLHAARCSFGMPGDTLQVEPLGAPLSRVLGEDYLVIGTAFGEGSIPADQPHGPNDFPVLAPDTVDGVLAAAGVGPCLLDLRTATGEVAAWWGTTRISRGLDSESTLPPSEAFDLLLYSPEVTRARLSATALARYAARGR